MSWYTKCSTKTLHRCLYIQLGNKAITHVCGKGKYYTDITHAYKVEQVNMGTMIGTCRKL